MNPLGSMLNLFWALCVGAVTLYAFLLALGAIAADDVMALTIAAGVVAVLCLAHFWHVRRALNDHRHDELARRVHMMRERRGF